MSKRTPAPLSYVAFCERVLQVQFTRAQRVLYRVAFDRIDPCDLPAEQRELAAQLFGPEVEAVPESARMVFAQRKGARVGGSRFAALRLLQLGITLPMSPAPGEVMAGVIVAPDLRLARQTLRYVTGAVHGTPELARLVVAESSDSITLRRPDGVAIEIVCLPATARGSAVRGRSLFGAVLSEASFMRDENYVANDREVFRPIVARVIAGGQVILESTPFSETDLLHELMEHNHSHPADALAAHCPTLLMRDDEHTRQLVVRERERDPENALREYDAEPMPRGTTHFFDPLALKQSADETLPLTLEPIDNETVLAIDTAFRRDASAGAVGRRNGSVIEISECIEIRPPAGGRLVPSETLRELLQRGAHHGAEVVIADQHYIETTREAVRKLDLGMQLIEAPGGATGKVDVFTRARTAIHEGRVRIPAEQKRLLLQLGEVVAKPTSGGRITISSPRRAGAHGDLASAAVLAIWRLDRKGVRAGYRALMDRMRSHRPVRGPVHGGGLLARDGDGGTGFRVRRGRGFGR